MNDIEEKRAKGTVTSEMLIRTKKGAWENDICTTHTRWDRCAWATLRRTKAMGRRIDEKLKKGGEDSGNVQE